MASLIALASNSSLVQSINICWHGFYVLNSDKYQYLAKYFKSNVGCYYVRDKGTVERTSHPSAKNHFAQCTGKFRTVAGSCVETRGGVENTKLEAKDTKKFESQAKTMDCLFEDRPLEAKDRNARGQGLRTQAEIFSK